MRSRLAVRAVEGELATGEILVYGDIAGAELWGGEVTPRAVRRALDELGRIQELRVQINSAGGDPFAAHAIYNILRRHEARKIVTVDGLAASAASLVAMAGDRIIMPRNAMMMVHNPWVFAAGDANYLRQVADSLDKVRDAMVETYAAKTGLMAEAIIPLLDAETWMTAQEAVERGFADEVEEREVDAKASASGKRLIVSGVEHDLSRYRHAARVAALFQRILAGVVPEDVSRETAPEDTPWEAPTLSDFTDESWDDLSDAEKRRIAGHYAWAADMPPEAFGDLKLPHHRPSDGAVVWRGVANAAARLEQSDIPAEDIPRVRAHLASHYRQFGRTPPWEEESRARVIPLSLAERILKFHERGGSR